ncbi:MAG: hypothetical protein ACI8ZX_003204 [Planctomycetota bacterium]|jgi:hypothetical protein
MLTEFVIKVRIVHKVDDILSNNYNLKTGSFYKFESEAYEEKINYCYDNINNELKEELLDYIKISLPIMKAEISYCKKQLKNSKKDYHFQREYLLAFMKAKHKFFYKWIKIKEKDISEYEKGDQVNKSKNKYDPGKYKWYQLIEPLVSGKISDIQRYTNRELEKTEFSKLIIEKLDIPLKVEDIEPYVYFSFIKNEEKPKNLFSKNKVILIYAYCSIHDIKIEDEIFLKKVNEYIKP